MDAPKRSLGSRFLGYLRLAAILYLGVLLLLLLFENWLVYHPFKAEDGWLSPPVREIGDVALTSADGTKLHAWWLPCADSAGALLYLHGNGGNLSGRGEDLVDLRRSLGVSVLIVDYPGYGKSEGAPSETGCYQAGDAGYNWLIQTKKIEPKKICLFGESMGGGVAVDLACRKPHRALILVKSFTAMPDVAAKIYPFLPVRWLMRNRYDNMEKLPKCTMPTFVAHGDVDRLIPFALGKKLFDAAPGPKEFLTMPGTDHNDPLPEVFFSSLRTFLEKHP